MEDLRKYTRKSELYKLSAEEQTEKMKLVMKEVEKISAYTGVSEEAAYNLFLNGYDVPSELDGQKIAFSESELTPTYSLIWQKTMYAALKSCPMNLLQPAIWITYISRKKIISFDKQKSTKNRMFSCFFNTHKF